MLERAADVAPKPKRMKPERKTVYLTGDRFPQPTLLEREEGATLKASEARPLDDALYTAWVGLAFRIQSEQGLPCTTRCPSCRVLHHGRPQEAPCAVCGTRRGVEEARRGLWDLIEMTPSLDWLLLTKRPENIREMVPASWLDGLWPPRRWAGTTVEDQKRAEERIPHLLRVPAPVRFLSCEPLLGELDLYRWLWQRVHDSYHGGVCTIPSEEISWVIAGGESGSRARPSHPDWFRGLRDQCQAAGVPFFFKQHGEWYPLPKSVCSGALDWAQANVDMPSNTRYHLFKDGTRLQWLGKKATGRVLDGRTWDEMPHGDRQTEQTDLSGASEAKGEGNR